jgi:hypothetical protein
MYLQRAIHSLATSSGSGGKGAKVNYSIFRNSELTMLLANGLTGNSKAAVIVTLSPAAQHFTTSLGSIEFAMEVKGIKMDVHSTVTVDPKTQIKQLEAEVASLRTQLAAAMAGQPLPAAIGDGAAPTAAPPEANGVAAAAAPAEATPAEASPAEAAPASPAAAGDPSPPEAAANPRRSLLAPAIDKPIRPLSEENLELMKENAAYRKEIHRLNIKLHQTGTAGRNNGEAKPGLCLKMQYCMGLKTRKSE